MTQVAPGRQEHAVHPLRLLPASSPTRRRVPPRSAQLIRLDEGECGRSRSGSAPRAPSWVDSPRVYLMAALASSGARAYIFDDVHASRPPFSRALELPCPTPRAAPKCSETDASSPLHPTARPVRPPTSASFSQCPAFSGTRARRPHRGISPLRARTPPARPRPPRTPSKRSPMQHDPVSVAAPLASAPGPCLRHALLRGTPWTSLAPFCMSGLVAPRRVSQGERLVLSFVRSPSTCLYRSWASVERILSRSRDQRAPSGSSQESRARRVTQRDARASRWL